MNNPSLYTDLKIANRCLFEQGQSFQGNMPLDIYFIFSEKGNSLDISNKLTVEEFAQLSADAFPFAETLIFCYENDEITKVSTPEFLEIAQQYIIGVDERDFVSCDCNLNALPTVNSSVVIRDNGDVLFIDAGEERRHIIIGNLKESRFPDIWFSPFYVKIRSSIGQQGSITLKSSFHVKDTAKALPIFSLQDSGLEPTDFLENIHQFEKKLVLEQKRILAEAVLNEEKLNHKIQRLYEKEKSVLAKTYFFQKHKRNSLAKTETIAKQFAGSVHDFGLLASVFCFEDIDRDINRALFGFGNEYQGNLPLRIELSILYGCNIRCFMCDLSKQNDDRQREMLTQRLDLETYKKLAEDLFPFAENMIIGVAGEPTLHPDFIEFLRIAKSYGVRLQLMTNGTTLHAKSIAEAVVKYVDEIVISMDGRTKETFEKIRTGANWERVVAGLKTIRDLREIIPDSNLKISINYALMKDNIDEFPLMFELAKEMGIYKVMGEHLIVTSPEISHQSLFNHPELSDQRLVEAFENSRKYGIEIIIPDLFNKKEQTKEILGSTLTGIRHDEIKRDIPFCRLLTYSVVIAPLGHVYPCCYPDAHRLLGMGNLHEKRFKQIWYGRSYQTLREGRNKNVPYPLQQLFVVRTVGWRCTPHEGY